MAPPKGYTHTPEAIARIAAASKARVFSAESNLKKSLALRGRVVPADQRAKMSAAKKGRPQTPEQIAGIRKWLSTPEFKVMNIGRTRTPEQRAKMSAAGIGNTHTKGRPLTDAHKAKVSLARTGRQKSAAHRAATSLAVRQSAKFMAASAAARIKAQAANRGAKRTDEVKLKMSRGNKASAKAAAQRARMFMASPSSIERAVHALLNTLGVPFEQQKQIGRYAVDIFVPSHQLVIECDGTYWHRNTAERDQRRDEYMRGLGLQVLRLPEPEIRSGKSFEIVRRVLAV